MVVTLYIPRDTKTYDINTISLNPPNLFPPTQLRKSFRILVTLMSLRWPLPVNQASAVKAMYSMIIVALQIMVVWSRLGEAGGLGWHRPHRQSLQYLAQVY